MNRRRLKAAVSLAALAGLLWLLSRIGWTEVGLRLAQVGATGFALLFLAGLAEAALDGAASGTRGRLCTFAPVTGFTSKESES